MSNTIQETFPDLVNVPDKVLESLQTLVDCYVAAIERTPKLPQFGRNPHIKAIVDEQEKVVALFKRYANEDCGKLDAAVYLLAQQTPVDVVPPTIFVRTNENSGCIIKYIEDSEDVEKLGTCVTAIPEEFQRICILDIRFGNPDRHDRNTLVVKDLEGGLRFAAIDFEDSFSSKYTISELWWIDQAAAGNAFTRRMKSYVDELDADKDINYLKSCGWKVPSRFTVPFKIFTFFVKKSVEIGLTPVEMGTLALGRHTQRSFNLQDIMSSVDLMTSVDRLPGDDDRFDDRFVKEAQEHIGLRLKQYAKKLKGLRKKSKKK